MAREKVSTLKAQLFVITIHHPTSEKETKLPTEFCLCIMLFRYNRLPFGVSAAPSIFQRTMENLLQGIPHVSVYLDDVLVTGRDDTEHLQNLSEVLRRVADAGMHLRKDKCYFMRPQVEYLGHTISSRGIQPTQNKVEAIRYAPTPANVHQLKSFLGLLNFYAKFLPNSATTLAP